MQNQSLLSMFGNNITSEHIQPAQNYNNIYYGSSYFCGQFYDKTPICDISNIQSQYLKSDISQNKADSAKIYEDALGKLLRINLNYNKRFNLNKWHEISGKRIKKVRYSQLDVLKVGYKLKYLLNKKQKMWYYKFMICLKKVQNKKGLEQLNISEQKQRNIMIMVQSMQIIITKFKYRFRKQLLSSAFQKLKLIIQNQRILQPKILVFANIIKSKLLSIFQNAIYSLKYNQKLYSKIDILTHTSTYIISNAQYIYLTFAFQTLKNHTISTQISTFHHQISHRPQINPILNINQKKFNPNIFQSNFQNKLKSQTYNNLPNLSYLQQINTYSMNKIKNEQDQLINQKFQIRQKFTQTARTENEYSIIIHSNELAKTIKKNNQNSQKYISEKKNIKKQLQMNMVGLSKKQLNPIKPLNIAPNHNVLRQITNFNQKPISNNLLINSKINKNIPSNPHSPDFTIINQFPDTNDYSQIFISKQSPQKKSKTSFSYHISTNNYHSNANIIESERVGQNKYQNIYENNFNNYGMSNIMPPQLNTQKRGVLAQPKKKIKFNKISQKPFYQNHYQVDTISKSLQHFWKKIQIENNRSPKIQNSDDKRNLNRVNSQKQMRFNNPQFQIKSNQLKYENKNIGANIINSTPRSQNNGRPISQNYVSPTNSISKMNFINSRQVNQNKNLFLKQNNIIRHNSQFIKNLNVGSREISSNNSSSNSARIQIFIKNVKTNNGQYINMDNGRQRVSGKFINPSMIQNRLGKVNVRQQYFGIDKKHINNNMNLGNNFFESKIINHISKSPPPQRFYIVNK